jgi:hypothetical protein
MEARENILADTFIQTDIQIKLSGYIKNYMEEGNDMSDKKTVFPNTKLAQKFLDQRRDFLTGYTKVDTETEKYLTELRRILSDQKPESLDHDIYARIQLLSYIIDVSQYKGT